MLAQLILTDAREVLGQKGHKLETTLDPACPQVAPRLMEIDLWSKQFLYEIEVGRSKVQIEMLSMGG